MCSNPISQGFAEEPWYALVLDKTVQGKDAEIPQICTSGIHSSCDACKKMCRQKDRTLLTALPINSNATKVREVARRLTFGNVQQQFSFNTDSFNSQM